MAKDHTSPEPQIRIFSYVGTPTNTFAEDGDYYVDELTNLLYGPKTDGVWPENGIPAIGVCKRSVYGIRAAPSRQSEFKNGRLSRGARFLWQWCNMLRLRIVGSRPSERQG
jgi:hypothetical protein